ncbi:MAG TPA: MMPL family transporter [Desulfuromonadales bacterium]|nr:MMPL family transporter [Desulfuromonadales bacterium]
MSKNWFNAASTRVNSLTQRHLEWIFRITTTRPLQVVLLFVVAILLSGLSLLSTRFDSDIFQLFPKRLPALRLMLDTMQWTGSAKEAYFLLEGDTRLLPQEAARFAERLRRAQVDGTPAFTRITWQIYDQSQAAAFREFIKFAVARPQLFINVTDVPDLAARFSATRLDSLLLRLQSELAGQIGGAMTGLATVDPLFVRELILPRIKSGSQALDLDPDSSYFISRDGSLLVMIAEPARSVQDMAFARKLVAAINLARRDLPLKISCAGAHISAVLDEAAMKSNILACILSSLVVVLGIFYATYRRILPTLLIPLILICGVTLALATAGLFSGSIHIISFAFMALIIGLGTDYSIHLYDRFHSERAAGVATADALHLALVDSGHGVFTAAITTALPFLALSISDVRALSELGLLVGLGVIFSLYATLFFLPPLLIFMERHFPADYRAVPGFGLGRLWRFATGRSVVVIMISVFVVIVLGVKALRIQFDGELKNLQPRHSEAFLAQEKIEKHLSLAPKQMLVAIEGSDLNQVLERTARVERVAEGLQQQGKVVAWSSIGRIINSPAMQGAVIAALGRVVKNGDLAISLSAALERHGFTREPFNDYLLVAETMKHAPLLSSSEALAGLAASPLKGVLDRHLIKDAAGWHALVYLHYRGPEFNLPVFISELAAIDPAARASSVDLISEQLSAAVRSGFVWAVVLGSVVVLFLLLAHFNSLAGIFYALFPVVAGSLAMLGIMAMSGMGLNFMNAMVLVTIIGMGSDYGLHIRHRIAEVTLQEQEQRFVQAGRAVLLSALTTIAGFGSLALADYPALASIGWATNFGVGCTAIFAMITLPAIVARVTK